MCLQLPTVPRWFDLVDDFRMMDKVDSLVTAHKRGQLKRCLQRMFAPNEAPFDNILLNRSTFEATRQRVSVLKQEEDSLRGRSKQFTNQSGGENYSRHGNCRVNRSSSLRIAATFHGLFRGMKHTTASIERNIFGPAVAAANSLDVFCHSMTLGNSSQFEQLRPCRSQVAEQSLVDAQQNFTLRGRDMLRRLKLSERLVPGYTETTIVNIFRSLAAS